MTEKTGLQFPLDEATVCKAAACNKGMHCLKRGPSCQIGAIIGKTTIIVNCTSRDTSCPYFQISGAVGSAESRGHCTCAVRLALLRKYGI